MNIYTAITNILTAINSNAVCYVLEKSRFEAETLNITTPAINIQPNIKGSTKLTKGGELMNTATYDILFLSQDEFDNSDNSADVLKKYTQNSMEIVETMRILANTVIKNLSQITNVKIYEFTYTNALRVNSNTMTGVNVTLKLTYSDNIICSYE
ncbi:MAG: hypothetical protein DRI95_00640 [Bacteroidetes bacterium]|nr:MAG: hypothetical protein DRI95_00640 [Bacteroidota bacterium]